MSAPVRVLLVDDEPLARDAIRALLAADPGVEVVGEGTGTEAAALIARTRPDLMFLDVQMPELDGFALLDAVGADAVPVVVFVTAYDRYALRAFDVHALDYLLKPFDDARFAATLARAKESVRARRRGEWDARVAALLEERARGAAARARFLIPSRERTVVVDAETIDWIEASDDYVTLHGGETEHLLRERMDEIEKQLDPVRFFRVHRSAIVNVDRVREIRPLFRGDCELVLAGGARLRLSRARRVEFEALLARPKAL